MFKLLFEIIILFVLQPLNILIGFITRFLWHPPVLSNEMLSFKTCCPSMSIDNMFNDRVKTLNRKYMIKHGDAGKFWSMYYWATNDESAWEDVIGMVDIENKTIHRNPQIYWKEDEKQFSGDQLAGFMGAVVNRIKTKGLTDEECEKLTKVWNSVSFDKFPMLFGHYTKGQMLERGFILRPYQIWNSASFIKTMTWLSLGYEITHEKKYIVLYYMIYVLFLPTLLLSSIDGEIFIGNIFATSANSAHSAMLDVTVGHMVRPTWIQNYWMWMIKRKRSNWSADFWALYKTYFNGKMTNEDMNLFSNLCYSTYLKGDKDTSSIERKMYVNLLGREKVDGFSEICSPSVRNADYTDERDFIINDNWWIEPKQCAIDVIFPIGIFLKKQ